MEFSLHRQLKDHYAPDSTATEVTVGSFRIDAVRRNGELVEIQFASLSAISRKIKALLEDGHRVRVVKPIVARRRLIKLDSPDGETISSRWSPKRGRPIDLFQELVYFTRVFPHPKLVIEAPVVEIEEYRLPQTKKRRRLFSRDYRLHDVRMTSLGKAMRVRTASDLWNMVSGDQLPTPFGTNDLSELLDCPRWLSQRIAYCLKHCGAVESIQRKKTGWLYRCAS